MRRTVLAVIGIALAAVTLTACDKSSYQCTNGSCDVSVSGTPSVDLSGHSSSPGSDDHEGPAGFTVVGYTSDGVSISSNGDQGTVKAGESKRIGELTFQVRSVDGDSAKMHVEG